MWRTRKDRKRRSRRRLPAIGQKGFTLIELMVSASILGLISLAILTTFGSGFSVYERIQSYGGTQADILLALEEMETNLRNAFPFTPIALQGDAQSVRLPAIIQGYISVDGEEVPVTSVGKVSYFLEEDDDGQPFLARLEQNYSEALKGDDVPDGRSSALASVRSVKFSYYAPSEDGKTYEWQDSWGEEDKGFPAGVKIEVTYQDGQAQADLTRTVMIPSMRVVDQREEEEGDGQEEG